MLRVKSIVPAVVLCSLAAISLTSSNVSASATFDGTGLDQDGTFHVNMAPPKTMTEKYTLNEMISDLTHSFGITSGGEWGCNDNFTSCRLVQYGTEWTDESYGITYIYNEAVDTIVDNLIDNSTFPDDGFFVSDLDLVKYLYQSGISNTPPLLPAFSSELKSFLGYKNLDFIVDVRMGGYDPFMDSQGGMAKVYYNGTLYNVYEGNVMVYAPHIFYVEDGTTNYVDALKNRLTNAFGEGILDMVGVEEENMTISEMYNTMCANDNWCENPATYYDSYSYFEDFLNDRLYSVCTYAEFDGQMFGVCYNAAIVADSSKITQVSTVNSTDVLTGVNISSTSVMLPGDATTYAESLGNSNEDIKNKIGSDKFALYELGLRSASLEEVSDSDDGFTVSIPIPDNLSGITNLSAYWLNATTGELEEHPAEISADGKTAAYETNHFSSYFLAESSISSPVVPNAGANSNKTTNEASISILGSIVTAISLAGFALSRKIKRIF